MTALIILEILVVFSISNCICGEISRTLSRTGDEILRKQFWKKFIKIFRTKKNQFLVLLMGFSYLSQNSSFKSKNLVLYLKVFALQNGNIFIQIWKIRLSSCISVPAWLSCSDSYVYAQYYWMLIYYIYFLLKNSTYRHKETFDDGLPDCWVLVAAGTDVGSVSVIECISRLFDVTVISIDVKRRITIKCKKIIRKIQWTTIRWKYHHSPISMIYSPHICFFYTCLSFQRIAKDK